MNIEPTKVVEELGQTWRSNALVVGGQVIMLIVLLVLFAWDRVETRKTMLTFVNNIMEKQDLQYAAMRSRLENMSAMVIECYRGRDAVPDSRDKGGSLEPPILLNEPIHG